MQFAIAHFFNPDSSPNHHELIYTGILLTRGSAKDFQSPFPNKGYHKENSLV